MAAQWRPGATPEHVSSVTDRAGQPASLRVVDGDPLLLISPRTEQGQVTVAETLQVARASGVSR
jgi:hypothetical protein